MVDFRDHLEEATALARAERGTERQPAAQPAQDPAASQDAAQPGATAVGTVPLPPPGAVTDGQALPQPFEPVGEGEIRSEQLDDGF